MPGLNRRGPAGEGPKTGRGLGRCGPGATSNDLAGDYARGEGWGRGQGGGRGRGQGWGRGRGCGQGRGWGRGWGAAANVRDRLTAEEERGLLQEEADQLARSLDSVRERLRAITPDEK